MGFQAYFSVLFVLSMAILLVQIDVSSSANNTAASNSSQPSVTSNITGGATHNHTHPPASTSANNVTAAPMPQTTKGKSGAEGVFSSMVIVSYALSLTMVANM